MIISGGNIRCASGSGFGGCGGGVGCRGSWPMATVTSREAVANRIARGGFIDSTPLAERRWPAKIVGGLRRIDSVGGTNLDRLCLKTALRVESVTPSARVAPL